MDLATIGTNLKLAMSGYYALAEDIVMKSFSDVGLWPMDYRFLKNLPGAVTRVLNVSADHVRTSASPSARALRRSDRGTVRKVQDALNKDMQPSKKVGTVLEYVQDHHKIGSAFEKYVCCIYHFSQGKESSLNHAQFCNKDLPFYFFGTWRVGERCQELQVAAAAEDVAEEEQRQPKREQRDRKRLEKENQKGWRRCEKC